MTNTEGFGYKLAEFGTIAGLGFFVALDLLGVGVGIAEGTEDGYKMSAMFAAPLLLATAILGASPLRSALRGY